MGAYSFLAQPYQPPSPLQTLGQLYALKNQQQEVAQRQQLMQNEQLAYEQNAQSWRDTQAVRQAYLQNQTPDGQFNQQGFLNQVRQTAPLKFPEVLQQQATLQQVQLTAAKNKADYVGQLMNGVSNQGSYDRAIHSATMQGIDTSQWPALYDPKFTAGLSGQAQTVSDFITGQTKQGTLAETQRHNKQDEYLKTLGLPIANQVTAAYGVPANQRTPAQNALITGYEHYVQTTSVNPRVAAVMARPVQVAADPSNPGNLSYVPAGQAMRGGMAAPGSASTQAAIGTAESATSGPIGSQLTAFNTAQHHLAAFRTATQAMQNGDLRTLNRIANEYHVQTGQSAPLVYNTVATALKGEMAKAFTGTGATVSEQEDLQKSFDAANNLQQNLDVANTFNTLLQGKKTALKGQVDQGMKGQPNWDPNAPAADLGKPNPKKGSAPKVTHRFNQTTGQIEAVTQ